MFKHPVMRRNAERHFLEALRLSPQDAELHTWLGLYYKTFGMGMRADAEFRTALEIDPDNRIAQKNLSSGANVTGHLKNPFKRLVTPH
jgi:Flp pilus assembly protein TadD